MQQVQIFTYVIHETSQQTQLNEKQTRFWRRGALKQKRHWLYHPLLLRAGGGSDVMTGKSWPRMLHSCDKAHILTAFVNSTQLINALVHRDGDVTEQEMVFGRGPECYNLPTRIWWTPLNYNSRFSKSLPTLLSLTSFWGCLPVSIRLTAPLFLTS